MRLRGRVAMDAGILLSDWGAVGKGFSCKKEKEWHKTTKKVSGFAGILRRFANGFFARNFI